MLHTNAQTPLVCFVMDFMQSKPPGMQASIFGAYWEGFVRKGIRHEMGDGRDGGTD